MLSNLGALVGVRKAQELIISSLPHGEPWKSEQLLEVNMKLEEIRFPPKTALIVECGSYYERLLLYHRIMNLNRERFPCSEWNQLHRMVAEQCNV